jgi:hypothetical protein
VIDLTAHKSLNTERPIGIVIPLLRFSWSDINHARIHLSAVATLHSGMALLTAHQIVRKELFEAGAVEKSDGHTLPNSVVRRHRQWPFQLMQYGYGQ